MKALPACDVWALHAAKGWLILGDVGEALKELERLTEGSCLHPISLAVFWKVLFAAERWDEAFTIARRLSEVHPDISFGPLCMAQSLKQRGHIAQAKLILLGAEKSFPHDPLISYNLACYCCRLGEIEEGQRWLAKALKLGGSEMIRAARIDPDLTPLRSVLKELLPSRTRQKHGDVDRTSGKPRFES